MMIDDGRTLSKTLHQGYTFAVEAGVVTWANELYGFVIIERDNHGV
jgi:hypothetical protein